MSTPRYLMEPAPAALGRHYGFRIANLLMQKRKEDTPERSKHDTFLTARDKNYEPLLVRAQKLVKGLEARGFVVHRTKIEDTLLDTKFGDVL